MFLQKMSVTINRINIRKDTNAKILVAGETVDGYVKISVTSPCKIYKFTIGLYGTGKSHWATEADNKKHRIRGYEEYNTVYDIIRDGEAINYTQGNYTIPFRIEVKESLPQSYEGIYSRIRYILRVKLKTAGEGEKISELVTVQYQQRVTVRVIRDLNKLLDKKGFPICGRKVSLESAFIEELGCWFSTLGKIVYQIYCLKQGFIRGEQIDIKVVCLNHTVALSCLLHYSFEQCTMNIHDNPALARTMAIVKPIAILDGEMLLPAAESEKTITFKLAKDIPISGCRDSNIVDISYSIKVQFELFTESSGTHTTRRIVTIPIIIGDVPLNLDKWKFLQNQKKWVRPNRFFIGMRKTWDTYELNIAKRFNREAFNKRIRRATRRAT